MRLAGGAASPNHPNPEVRPSSRKRDSPKQERNHAQVNLDLRRDQLGGSPASAAVAGGNEQPSEGDAEAADPRDGGPEIVAPRMSPDHSDTIGEETKRGAPLGPADPPVRRRSAALYLRVSTEDQDLVGQERDLRAETARRGWEVVAVYSEKVSGYRASRAGGVRPAPPRRRSTKSRLDRPPRLGARPLEPRGAVRPSRRRDPRRGKGWSEFPEPERTVSLNARDRRRQRGFCPEPTAGRRHIGRFVRVPAEIRAGSDSHAGDSGGPSTHPIRGGPPDDPGVTPEKAAKIAELRPLGLKWREIAGRVGLPAETCAAVWSKARRFGPGPGEGGPGGGG